MIICPKCKLELLKIDNTYKCINCHSYDIAKSGYINLLLSRVNTGDNKEMLLSRDNFLEQDFYLPIAELISEKILPPKPIIIDCGCGTGYYLNCISKRNSGTFFGVDISKIAIEKAAKKNKDILYVVASNYNVPFKDECADILLNIFAPYCDKEFNRLLKHTGKLITVSANVNHLQEIKNLIYKTPHINIDKVYDLPSFELLEEQTLEYKMMLSQDNLISLFKMTPYYFKTKSEDFEKLLSVKTFEVTASFILKIYQKKLIVFFS